VRNVCATTVGFQNEASSVSPSFDKENVRAMTQRGPVAKGGQTCATSMGIASGSTTILIKKNNDTLEDLLNGRSSSFDNINPITNT
jgi:hypothetical protein